jgi:hypothetical protein
VRYFANHPKLDWHDLEAQRQADAGRADAGRADAGRADAGRADPLDHRTLHVF